MIHNMEIVNYTVKIHPAAEGGYWAEVPALKGCFTQAETLGEIKVLVEEAIECHLSSLIRRGERLPVEKSTKRSFAFPVSVRAPMTT